MNLKKLTSSDFQALTRFPRVNLMNALTGFKSPNLIGTLNPETKVDNVTIFSSAVHFGSNPPLIGLVTRPVDVERKTSRHSYENIQKTGCFTINHVNRAIIDKAHQSSASYADGISEFEAVGLTPLYSEGFPAPYVAESSIRMGLELREEIPIESNGTILLIGEVVELFIPEHCLSDELYLDIEAAGSVALSGLDSYHATERVRQLGYARP